MKYIDNTTTDQNVISLLSVGCSETRHGLKYRLRKVFREIDGTYNLQEALHMVQTAQAVISFNETTELGRLIIESNFNICDELPDYNYYDASKSPELQLI